MPRFVGTLDVAECLDAGPRLVNANELVEAASRFTRVTAARCAQL
jgi:hypothetical protein